MAQCDVVLAMYHDQGLPVLKHAGVEHGINITLGLPYPRVAVDHGTALELAGRGIADASSLCAAFAPGSALTWARSAGAGSSEERRAGNEWVGRVCSRRRADN